MSTSWRGFLRIVVAVVVMASSLGYSLNRVEAVAAIQINPASAPSGTQVTVTGTGFAPGSPPCQVRFGINGSAVFGSWGGSVVAACTVNPNGGLTATFTAPQTAPGSYTIGVCNYCNGGEFVETATATLTVIASVTTTIAPTTTTSPSQSTTSIPPTTTSLPPTTQPPIIESNLSEIPPLVNGSGVPDLGGLLGDEGPWRPISVDNGQIDVPERWLERCAAPPEAMTADFDDLAVGSPVGRILRGGPGSPGSEPLLVNNLGNPNVVRSPSFGTWSAPNAVAVELPDGRTPYEAYSARDGIIRPFVNFWGRKPGSYDYQSFTYFGFRVGLARDESGPVTVELGAVALTPDGVENVVDVDRLVLGPERAPALSCMIVVAPPGTQFNVARLSAYTQDSSTAEILYDGMFWSNDRAFPLDDTPALIPVEITFPADGQELSASRTTSVIGRVRWPAAQATPNVGLMVPTWDGSGILHTRAEVGRPIRDGPDSVALFWSNGIRIPRGRFEIRAIASAPYGRGSDSVAPVGIGLPIAPPNEYRRRMEGQVDIVPWALEVTQAIRGPLEVQEPGSVVDDNFENIAGKATVVRGYGTHQFDGDDVGIRPGTLLADAVLHGTRNGVTLPLSPLSPTSSAVPLRVLEPGPAAEAIQRPSTALTWNFELPHSWTTGDPIELRLEVNPSSSRFHIEELADTDGQDNIIGRRVAFRQMGMVGVSVVNVNLRWRCTDAMVRNPMHICAGLRVGRSISQVLDWDTLNQTVRDWWRMWPAFGDFPSYLRIEDVALPYEPDDLPVAEREDRIFSAEWSDWREAYGELYCDGSLGSSSSIRSSKTRHMIWMTQPPWSPIGVGGCARLGENSPFLASANPPTVAQEAGHTFGLMHTSGAHGELFGGDSVIRFPGDHGQLGSPGRAEWGFDTAAGVVIDPQFDSDGHVHDFMSYGPGLRWVSVGTWNHVALSLGNNRVYDDSRGRVSERRERRSRTAAAPTGQSEFDEPEQWLYEGFIAEDGSVTIGVPRLVDPATVVDFEGDDVFLTLRDESGTTLSRVGVATYQTHTHGGVGGRSFAILVPPESEARSLVLEVTGGATVEVRGSGGSVSIDEVRREGNRLELSWQGMPPNSTAIAEVQQPGGDWWPLATIEGSLLDVDLSDLPYAGDGWQLRVQSTDGVTVTADEVDFDFGQPPPRASIAIPASGERVVEGMLSAVAGVNTIGGSTAVYTWLVNGQPVNQGPEASIPISRGVQTVTLRVETDGVVHETSVDVSGVVDTDGDGLDDEWESTNGFDPATFDDVSGDVDGDGAQEGREYRFGSDPRSSDTDGDGFSDGEEIALGSDPVDESKIPGPQHGFDDHDHSSHSHGLGTSVWVGIIGAVTIAVLGGVLLSRRFVRRRSEVA